MFTSKSNLFVLRRPKYPNHFVLKIRPGGFADYTKFHSVLCYTDMLNTEEKILIKRIAQRIKDLRKRKGTSQRLMYYDTEINMGRLETGKENIKVTTIAKLCQYFHITLEEFFRDIEKEPDGSPPGKRPPKV